MKARTTRPIGKPQWKKPPGSGGVEQFYVGKWCVAFIYPDGTYDADGSTHFWHIIWPDYRWSASDDKLTARRYVEATIRESIKEWRSGATSQSIG